MDDSHICIHCQYCVIQQFVSACQQLEWLLDRVLLGYDRVHEVEGLPPASSYIRHRILMYELAGDFTKK